MGDLITIIIDQELFTEILIFGSIFIFLISIYLLVSEIQKTFRTYQKRKLILEAQPYKKEYEKLLKEKKYKEARAYGKRYDYYLREAYYYW